MKTKRCGKCEKNRAIKFFKTQKLSKAGKPILYAWCRPCQLAYQREYRRRPERLEYERKRRKLPHRRLAAKSYQRRPDVKRAAYARRILREFGITVEDVARLYNEQGGRCPGCLCPLDFGPLTMIDHSHRTGEVRGLLCRDCNWALGVLGENQLRMQRLIGYLRAPKEVRCRMG